MPKNKYNNSLGELEKKIMEAVWDLKRASVRDVLNKIKKNDKPAYTTVMTVMSRLYKKNILKRKMSKNEAYIYTPAKDKEKFSTSITKNIIQSLINEYGEDIAVTQFINIVENSDLKKSKEWRQKLKKVIG